MDNFTKITKGLKVGIIGTGVLGPSIAQVFAQTEDVATVYLCKGRASSINDGKDSIEKSLAKLVSKQKITREQADTCLNKIVTGTKEIVLDADLIIEAVSENLEIKNRLFRDLDEMCKQSCIFATNTSSLPIKAIAEGLRGPLVGMHFFNPAPVMKLVEIITANDTPRDTADFLINMAKRIGKTPVEVREAPGFIVNRILIPMINEAIGIYAEGVASVEDIDTAMRLGANHPMGPLALGDLIGLDVVLAIMEVMLKETGDVKYRPEPMLKKMVREGKLGRKTGEGFYQY